MRSLAKFLFRLIILGALALAAYAMLAELPAPQRAVTIPLETPPAEN